MHHPRISTLLLLSLPVLAGCVTDTPAPPGSPAADLAEAARARPGDARAQYRHGNLLFDLGRYAEAQEAYVGAIQADPDFGDAYTNLGLTLRHLGRLEEAARAYEHALEIMPEDIITLRNRKALAELMNDGPAYTDCVRRLATLLPEEPSSQRELAALLLSEEDYAGAADLYERLSVAGMNDADLFYNLGLCYFRLDRFEAAGPAWQAAVRADTRHASANRGLAVLYWTTGDYEAAWAQVRRCQQLDVGLDREFLDLLRRDSGKQTSL